MTLERVAGPPDFFDKLAGILEPGGDPDAVRRAAAACRKLSTDLEDRLDTLDPCATGLRDFWEGKAGDGFQRTWQRFVPGLTEYAGHFEEAAQALDRIADVVHEAQVKAHHLKIAMAVTAGIGIVVTAFSFGGGADLTAAALEAEAGAFAIWLAETLGAEIATIEALLMAIETTTARFALGAGVSAVAVGAVKGFNGQNPLDPAKWSADDVTHVLFDGVLTAGVGAVADTAGVAAALESRPYLGAAGAGALRSGTASALGQFWLNGNSLTDLDAWGKVGMSAGIAGVSGLGVARVGGGSAGDLTRGFTGIPSGTASYALSFPQAGPALGVGPAAPIPELPVVPLPPPAPPAGGRTYIVRPGDSLWVVAGRRLGDPTLWPRIAEANGIGAPYTIFPNQRLRIPSPT